MYDQDDVIFSLTELRQERAKANCDFYPTRRKALDIAIFFLERAVVQMIEQDDEFFSYGT